MFLLTLLRVQAATPKSTKPVHFIQNRGQIQKEKRNLQQEIEYVAMVQGATIYFAADQIIYNFQKKESSSKQGKNSGKEAMKE
ncbi:hypothetical protein [Rufibacter roseolus]|uniref:hypothetical protein n=1 Tax=Rufibacter roseolus TaxID=2817375 RepID=UPI001B3063D8|nr:hypothetical protein [Rufibacter roseolus]